MIIRKEEASAIDFSGLRILDYTANSSEKSSFAVIDVPAGVSHKLSWSRRSDKYYYIISGVLDFTVNNQNFILKCGDFCAIGKGDKFRYANSSGEAASVVLIHTPSFDINEEVFE